MAAILVASWPWVGTRLHSVVDQPDKESIAAQYDRIVDVLLTRREKPPDAQDLGTLLGTKFRATSLNRCNPAQQPRPSTMTAVMTRRPVGRPAEVRQARVPDDTR
jgi:hypothetical protein